MASLILHSTFQVLTKAPLLSNLFKLPMSFTEATQKRRSIRALEPKTTVPDSTIVQLAEAAILTVPSAFNSQTTRLTVLFGDDHKSL